MAGPRLQPIIPRGPVTPSRGASLGALSDALRDVTSEGQRTVAEYPVQTLTATGYVRTGTLKRSWSKTPIKRRGSRLEGEVGSNSNIAPYNQEVQGGRFVQKRLFRKAGWTGVDELEESMAADLERRVQDGIDGTVERL